MNGDRVDRGADRFRVPQAAGPARAVIADRPGRAALQAVGAAVAAGLCFRVGGDGLPAPETRAGLPMFETLTSGTSGTPRRIRRSQASWIASFAVNAGLFGIGPGVRVAVLGRLSQSLALYGAVEALHLGAGLALLDGLRPDRQRAALAGAGVLYATPTQLRLLIEAGGPPLTDLRFVLVGGAALDAATRAGVAAICPAAAIREFYGAAEASFVTLADGDAPEGSVGRVYPGVSLCLRDAAGAAVAEGQRGQIWLRSPYVFQGYGVPEPGGAEWRDGWLTVGEWGWLRDGYLHLAGRAGRMVTVADENVFPEEIEIFLAGLPGVARVAVLPRPDPRRGHVLDAVLLGDPAQGPAILAAARARFGPLKAPRCLHWRGDWPLLPSGKTDLAALAAGL
ncbi:AMP-binding protein [Paracoccaceae bacterium Fryx2]|nr:AMP-binding protein [Paracoccaceae bacterium Fryx2]